MITTYTMPVQVEIEARFLLPGERFEYHSQTVEVITLHESDSTTTRFFGNVTDPYGKVRTEAMELPARLLVDVVERRVAVEVEEG